MVKPPLVKSRPRGRKLLSPREIYAYLDLHVVGQEAAKRALSVAAYTHLRRCALPASERRALRKSNVLLIGPTGSGKTHLGRKLAELVDLPLSIADATEYTEAGYYGKDIETMVAELLFRSGYAVEEAQQGIIFLDEIDKLARRAQSYKTGGGTRDIGGEGVQQALLKVLEGRELFVPLNLTQHVSKHELLQVDTSDILFIAAGTFSDLFDYRTSGSVGVTGFVGSRSAGRRAISTEDLVSFGMLPELLGRLPVRVELDALSEDELLGVLTGPPDALLREYRQLLALDEVQLEFSEAALREVARAALRERSGARGLRTLMEAVCGDLLFDAPERRGETLSIDADYVMERIHRAKNVRT